MQAHITYKFKSQTKNGYISFIGDKIQGKVLKKEIASKTGSKEEELVLEDQQRRIKYKDDDFIKAYSVIIIERVNPSYIYAINNQNNSTPNNQLNKNINLSGRQQLEVILDKAKIFMIKSSKETNIQRAKDQSLWATTLINQRKFKDAFEQNQHVLLFCKASNSNNLQGIARMEEKPHRSRIKTYGLVYRQLNQEETLKQNGQAKVLQLVVIMNIKQIHSQNNMQVEVLIVNKYRNSLEKKWPSYFNFQYNKKLHQLIFLLIKNNKKQSTFIKYQIPTYSMIPNPSINQLLSMFNDYIIKIKCLSQKNSNEKNLNVFIMHKDSNS